MLKKSLTFLLVLICLGLRADYLDDGFAAPPNQAKPQTWWHWMNCNITKEGIKADIDAMHKAGVGGFTILDIAEGIPEGDVKTASPEWFDMVQYAIECAASHGMEVCVHNCPGWSSSGGPWIQKEDAMKKLTYSETAVEGGRQVAVALPRPPVVMDFYRDIAVIAFPTPADGTRIPNIAGKAYFDLSTNHAYGKEPPAAAIIKRENIINVTDRMDKDGNLKWQCPAGNWTIVRFGFTLTGRYNHPTTRYGRGLECDKLSKKGVKAAWDGMMGIIVKNAGRLSGTALKGSLIDSYEVGAQNWTDNFPADFRRYRNYDVIPLLPILTGRYVESQEFSERFLDDFRRTISELFAECYSEYFNVLCKQANLDFFVEPYIGPFDEILQGRAADVPMGEFWGGSNGTWKAELAGNIAQVFGHKYASTETFTADPNNGRWQMQPSDRKIQGDNAYIAGVNRFIFHSYAHQPWDVTTPGMTMGQWGFHFNRHNTLWKTFPAWLAYLGRAQYMLQQGRVVSDALYIAQQSVPCTDNYNPRLPAGYHANCIDVRSFLEMVKMKKGNVALPNGLTFPLLVANNTANVSPDVLRKLLKLANEGAVILLGEPTKHAFGLTDYPSADIETQKLVRQLWGGLDGKEYTFRNIGDGRVYYGVKPEAILKDLAIAPDFQAEFLPEQVTRPVSYLHRQDDHGNDWYFISNPQQMPVEFTGVFRIDNRVPELWDAQTGKCIDAPAYECVNGSVRVPLRLAQSGSLFVVFRKPAVKKVFYFFKQRVNHIADVAWYPQKTEEDTIDLVIKKATYAANDGFASKDVTERVKSLVAKDGTLNIIASNDVLGGDPAVLHLKHLDLEYTLNGKAFKVSFPENGSVQIPAGIVGKPDYDIIGLDGAVALTAWENGVLVVTNLKGKMSFIPAIGVPKPIAIDGAWEVSFPPNLGAPAKATFPELISFPESKDNGIKFFSGTATYRKTVNLPEEYVNSPLMLDLGMLHDNARVFINGRDCGILWKAPFRVNATGIMKAGANDIRIEVTNRWVNRLIGDEELPPDVEWAGKRLKEWPKWFLEGKTSPTGRIAFTTWHHWYKGDPLKPAGLIGPVQLRIGLRK